MFARTRTLLGLVAPPQQHALKAAASAYARFGVSSQDISAANQEMDDFFGVVNLSKITSNRAPPTPHAHRVADDAVGPMEADTLATAPTAHHLTTSTEHSLNPSYASTSFASSAFTTASDTDASDAAVGLQPFNSYVSGGSPVPPTSAPQAPSPAPSQLDRAPEPECLAQRRLSHIDSSGSASMVDVSQKAVTTREAQASCVVSLGGAFDAVASNALSKGDVLKVAQLAGIGGAKATSSLIPLCHNIPISKVDVQLHLDHGSRSVVIRALARTDGKTGVEMEALTAASVAALTVYDMAKAAATDMVVGALQLDYKAGGRSGTYLRAGLRRADLLPSARPPL